MTRRVAGLIGAFGFFAMAFGPAPVGRRATEPGADGISAASAASVNPLTCRFDRSVMQVDWGFVETGPGPGFCRCATKRGGGTMLGRSVTGTTTVSAPKRSHHETHCQHSRARRHLGRARRIRADAEDGQGSRHPQLRRQRHAGRLRPARRAGQLDRPRRRRLPRRRRRDLQRRQQGQVRAAVGQGPLHRAAIGRSRRAGAQHHLDLVRATPRSASTSPASITTTARASWCARR